MLNLCASLNPSNSHSVVGRPAFFQAPFSVKVAAMTALVTSVFLSCTSLVGGAAFAVLIGGGLACVIGLCAVFVSLVALTFSGFILLSVMKQMTCAKEASLHLPNFPKSPVHDNMIDSCS